MTLCRKFGISAVKDRLRNDTHLNFESLQKQLTHEATKGIGPMQYEALQPYSGTAPLNTEEYITTLNGRTAGRLKLQFDGTRLKSLEADGPHGVPDGWRALDKLSVGDDGNRKLRTVLKGPDGQSGKVVYKLEGSTLVLDKIYRCTLPGQLAGVPGVLTKVSTMNYMSARAFKILGANSDNVTNIKGSRMQNQLLLGHLHWLLEKYPDRTAAELIYKTSWAKGIESTLGILGQRLDKGAEVVPQDSRAWEKAHPEAEKRAWSYPQEEASRLAIKHMTGVKIPHVDASVGDWKSEGKNALKGHFDALLDKHGESKGNKLIERTKTRLQAIDGEKQRVEQRYGVDPTKGPRLMNFDVVIPTKKL